MDFTVERASRFFKVLPLTHRAKQMCLELQSRFTYKSFVKFGKAALPPDQIKIYACGLFDNTEFRFHINSYHVFLDNIKGFYPSGAKYTVVDKSLPECEKRNIAIKPEWKVRDYQEPIIEYLVAGKPKDKFIGIQTGKGKTFCSLVGVSKIGYRTIIIVEGGLITKWASDILKVLDIPAKRTLCVRGSQQLKGLISLANTKEFENIDVILLSNTTLQDWITIHETLSHEKGIDIGYGVHPELFYEHLKIGHRLIDEVHKKFHFNYKQDLYTNTHHVTSLSATLFSYDKQQEGYYEIAYPKAERYKAGEVDKYCKSYAVVYRIDKEKKIKTKEFGREEYSHLAFEKSILRNKELKYNYFNLIVEIMYEGYIPNYKPGNKIAIYVSTTDLATELVNFLKRKFPDKTVERYVSTLKDPYKNLLDPDIRVSTLGSGGTGHDIIGLTDTILTIAIMSLQANVQVFGRTRFIKDQDTRFFFLNCVNIKAHMKYLDLKSKLMKEIAKGYDILNYSKEL